jgi:hypothetical protein
MSQATARTPWIRFTLALVALAACWSCGSEEPQRRYETSLRVKSTALEVEALHVEAISRSGTALLAQLAESGDSSELAAAVDSEQGGSMAAYGPHSLGIYAVLDTDEPDRLRVWCWSNRHAIDAAAVRDALEQVLAEHSIEFSKPGE